MVDGLTAKLCEPLVHEYHNERFPVGEKRIVFDREFESLVNGIQISL